MRGWIGRITVHKAQFEGDPLYVLPLYRLRFNVQWGNHPLEIVSAPTAERRYQHHTYQL